MRRIISILILIPAVCGLANSQGKTSVINYRGEICLGDCQSISHKANGNGILAESTNGILIKDKFFTGIQTGYMYSLTNSDSFLTAGIDNKYMITNKSNTVVPFAALRLGGIFNVNKVDNALLVSPAIGLEISHFVVRFAYQYFNGYTQIKENGRITNDSYHINSVCVSLGVTFN